MVRGSAGRHALPHPPGPIPRIRDSSMDYLQRLSAEWYEYQGYFVHTDLWVGLESDGSYECELDVVAFHPLRRHLVHLEPSFDLLSWEERERHFAPKFAAGRKYLHRLFGTGEQVHLEQIALIVADEETPRTIAGARLLRLSDFMAAMLEALSTFDMAEAVVPEQWPLIRTLQFVAAYRGRLVPLLGGGVQQPAAIAPAWRAAEPT